MENRKINKVLIGNNALLAVLAPNMMATPSAMFISGHQSRQTGDEMFEAAQGVAHDYSSAVLQARRLAIALHRGLTRKQQSDVILSKA